MRNEYFKDFTKTIMHEVELEKALPANSMKELSKKLGWKPSKVHSVIAEIRERAKSDPDQTYTVAPVKRGRSSGRYFALQIDRSGRARKLTGKDGDAAMEGTAGTLRESQSKMETLRFSLQILAKEVPSVLQRRMFAEVAGNTGVVIKKIEKLLRLVA